MSSVYLVYHPGESACISGDSWEARVPCVPCGPSWSTFLGEEGREIWENLYHVHHSGQPSWEGERLVYLVYHSGQLIREMRETVYHV